MSNAGMGGRTHLIFEFTSDPLEERGSFFFLTKNFGRSAVILPMV